MLIFKKVIFYFLFIMILILLFVDNSFSINYYVNPSQGNDQWNGLAKTYQSGTHGPWQHIPGTVGVSGTGWVKLSPGDTITVKGGEIIYDKISVDSDNSDSYYNNGTDGSLIIIQSGHLVGWGSTRAIVDGGNTRAYGFYLGDYGGGSIYYIKITGFEIRNMANVNGSSGIILPGARYCEITDNYIHHIPGHGARGYGIIVEGSGCSYCKIDMNEICYTGTKGIEINPPAPNCLIEYNYIYDTEDHGMCINGNYGTVRNNLVRHCGTQYTPAYGIKCDESKYNEIYNNIIWDCKAGLAILNGSYNKFYHNTVYYCGWADMYHIDLGSVVSFSMRSDGTSALPVEGNEIKNNIFYYNNLSYGSKSGTFSLKNNIGNNNIVQNNIIYHDGDHMDSLIRYWDDSAVYYHDIKWFEGPSGFSAIGQGNFASGNISVEPNMRGGIGEALLSSSPTGFDANLKPNSDGFKLKLNSPPEVKVSKFELLPLDIEKTVRKNFSIGAYEYSSDSPLPPPYELNIADIKKTN